MRSGDGGTYLGLSDDICDSVVTKLLCTEDESTVPGDGWEGRSGQSMLSSRGRRAEQDLLCLEGGDLCLGDHEGLAGHAASGSDILLDLLLSGKEDS